LWWTPSCRRAPCPACSCSTSGPWTARSMPRWARARPRLVLLEGVLVALARVLPGCMRGGKRPGALPRPLTTRGARSPCTRPASSSPTTPTATWSSSPPSSTRSSRSTQARLASGGLLLFTAAPLHLPRHGCTFAHAARSPRRHARAAVEQVADHRAGGHGRRHPRGAQPARRPLHGHRAVLRRGASPPRDASPPRPLLTCLNSQLSAAAVPASWHCTHLWPLSRRPANRQALTAVRARRSRLTRPTSARLTWGAPRAQASQARRSSTPTRTRCT